MLIGHAMPMSVVPLPAMRRWAAAVLLLASSVSVMVATGSTRSWHRSASATALSTTAADARQAQARAAGIESDTAANAVRHHVAPRPGHPGELVATGDDFRVTFGANGVSFTEDGSQTPLGVSVETAARGDHDLALTAGTWGSSTGGAAREVAPGVREVVTVRSGEIEWDVVLASAPAGRGDLVVTAALTGVAHTERDASGLRVALAGGGDLRVGALVVKDATGRVLHRAIPVAEGNRLRLVVPDQVLSDARYPVTLDPKVGAEKTVNSSSGPPGTSAIAFDGTNYLVVWRDSRGENGDIYGARVRPDRTVLDPTGFVISSAVGLQEEPAVAYDGTHYLVVWKDRRSGSSFDIYGARVTPAGTVVDAAGLPFSTAPIDQTKPDLAFAGSTALVVWQDIRSATSWDIYGARWTEASGLQPGVIPISVRTDGGELNPAVTYHGPDFLVVWDDYRSRSTEDIYATRVTPSGKVSDTNGIPISNGPGHQFDPDVAFDGTDVLIVWTDGRSGELDIYGARWSPTTGLIDPTGLPITTASGTQQDASVAANGSFLVTWVDVGMTGTIVGARVSRAEGVIDPDFVIGTGADPAVIKGDGAKWALTYGRNSRTYFRAIAPK